MNSNQRTLIHLGFIKGVGPAVIHKLLSTIAADEVHTLYQYSVADFMHEFQLSSTQATLISNGLASFQELDKELSLANTYNVKILTVLDDDYPEALKQIHYPPPVIYVKGDLPCKYKALAIVGSRKANIYAQNVIDQLVSQLVAYNWSIVSGGALGADTMAHNATLAAQGKTIAVLGAGLLQLYPKSNLRMFEKILTHGGALVSPFPLNFGALQGNFPARNRIISGLSLGCLVVQAAERSGASITARYALEQGREVFAIPGSIFDELSVGCHRLVQQGAKLVSNVDDILIEFGEQSEKAETLALVQESILKKPMTIQEKVLIVCKNPQPIDALIEEIDKSLEDIQTVLFDLQIAGRITQDLSGKWHSL